MAVSDLIITRRNDTAIPLRNVEDAAAQTNPVRNGQRWQVTAIDSANSRLIARRLDDNTLGAFANDYVREHITYGYAMTVHSAQGVTTETAHAVMGDTATRTLAYVAMTRGRDTNNAYLYERATEREDASRPDYVCADTLCGTGRHAARVLRAILAHDEHSAAALGIAAAADCESSPACIAGAVDEHTASLRRRRNQYERWRVASAAASSAVREASGRDLGTVLSSDHGLEF